MKRAGQLLAVLCVVALVVTLYGCSGSGSPTGSPTGRGRSIDTAAKGGIPGPPDKEPQPPPDPAIAFTGGGELWVMNADGTNRTKLVGDARVSSPNWSPDGQRLVFLNTDTSTLQGKGIYLVSVSVVEGEVVPGSPELLVEAPDPFCWIASPAWSPLLGDNRIAYAWAEDADPSIDPGEVRAVAVEGGTPDILYDFGDVEDSSIPLYPLGGVSWSPQADRITVAIYDESIQESTKSSLAILELGTGGELENVTRPAGFDWVWGVDDVDWARHSDRIAFFGRMAGEASALWILDLGTGASQKLIEDIGINCSPSWSPDDTQLVIRKGRELCFVHAETGAQTPLPGKNWKQRTGSYPDWRRF